MEIEDSQENADALDVGENADALDAEEEDPDTDDSGRPQRKKNGSGLAGRILSALTIFAGAIADAAQVRGRMPFVTVEWAWPRCVAPQTVSWPAR